MTAACALALAGPAPALAVCPNEDAIPTAENLEEIRAAVICLHNEVRREANVALLSPDARLTTAAEGHAHDMVAQGYFGHDSPSGSDPFDRMRQAGYIGRRFVWNAGETIAWAPGLLATPRRVMDAWMKATSQRLTLLAPDFRDIGVGIALGAPVEQTPGSAPAVTFTVDYGWRTRRRSLRRGLRRATRNRQALRRINGAKCHGLARGGSSR